MIKVYIYDDLPESGRYGRLLSQLVRQLKRNRVIFINPSKEIQKYSRTPSAKKLKLFDLALGVGKGGFSIARQINKRLKIFPKLEYIKIHRTEVSPGRYMVKNFDPKYFKNLKCASLAIVEDTIYSGLTLGRILKSLPKPLLKNTHVFCLQGIKSSINKLERQCKVSAMVKIKGKKDREVTIIKLSGLFTPGAI